MAWVANIEFVEEGICKVIVACYRRAILSDVCPGNWCWRGKSRRAYYVGTTVGVVERAVLGGSIGPHGTDFTCIKSDSGIVVRLVAMLVT